MSSNSRLKSKTALAALSLGLGLSCNAWADEERPPETPPRVTQHVTQPEPPKTPVQGDKGTDFPKLRIYEARLDTPAGAKRSTARPHEVGDRGMYFGNWQPAASPRQFLRQAMLNGGSLQG